MAFELPALGYAYDALEPAIDARTMEIHHTKHHNGYTNKLNAAIEGTSLEGKSITEILTSLDMTNSAVRNNGGGFYNHSLFWEVMAPEDRGRLSGDLAKAVNDAYGSYDDFKEAFAKAAAKLAADKVRNEANKKADSIVNEAQKKADEIMAKARKEADAKLQ